MRMPAAVQDMGSLGDGGVIDTNLLIVGAPAWEVVVVAGAGNSSGGGDWRIDVYCGGADIYQWCSLVEMSSGRHIVVAWTEGPCRSNRTGVVRGRVDLGRREEDATTSSSTSWAGPV